jgi:hypothetical protein
MTKLLIGVAGKARSGKDTFANACVKGRGYTQGSFAHALKYVVAYIANEPVHLYVDDVPKEDFSESLGMVRRKALQVIGSAVRNEIGVDTWVNRLLDSWRINGEYPMVISDCRYPNEARAILDAGGIVVRIHRPDNVGLTGEVALHESEQVLANHLISEEVFNTGGIKDLEAAAMRITAALSARVEG